MIRQSNLPEEIWKPIPNWQYYEVSNLGRVRSLTRKGSFGQGNYPRTGKILSPARHEHGYPVVSLNETPRRRLIAVHTLVLTTFVGPKPPGKACCHKNDVPDDNRLENLYWGTKKQNWEDARKNGGALKMAKGEDQPSSKLSEEDIKYIRENIVLGKRGGGLNRSPYSTRALAKKFGVNNQSILNIINRSTWKHI